MEKKIGRELNTEEVIHHVNFDSTDNRIENLVMLTKKGHMLLHSQLEYVMKKLMRMDKVGFDGEQYFVK